MALVSASTTVLVGVNVACMVLRDEEDGWTEGGVRLATDRIGVFVLLRVSVNGAVDRL